MNRSALINVVSFAGIVTITIAVIFFSKGWRLNVSDKTIVSTGILDITSDPKGALVYINGEQKGKTPTIIDSLEPGDYNIELRAENFVEWSKTVKVEEHSVSKLEANLFGVDTKIDQIGEVPLEKIIFNPKGNQAIIVSTSPGNEGIWKSQLKASFFTQSGSMTKVSDLEENGMYNLLSEDYEISASSDFAYLLLTTDTKNAYRHFIFNLSTQEVNEITEYLNQNHNITWSSRGHNLIIQNSAQLLTLRPEDFNLSVISNWNAGIWTETDERIFFIVKNERKETSTFFSSRWDGTDRQKIKITELNMEEISQIGANPVQEKVVISTMSSVHLYDLKTNEIQVLAEKKLIPEYNSPNFRYTLLSEDLGEGRYNLYTYDFEFPQLSLVLENTTQDPESITWAPNDLKLFYRYTNTKGINIVDSIDVTGGNEFEVLALPNYAGELATQIGFSENAREIFLPLLSGTVSLQSAEDAETTQTNEVVMHELKLR